MPLNIAPSPLESFQMGQARGRANSPVTGIGLAIKNVVETARKKGLLRAQSLYQAEGANQTAILAENRKALRGKEEIPFSTIGPGGEVSKQSPVTRDTVIKSEPTQTKSLLSEIMELQELKKGIGGVMPGTEDESGGDPIVTIEFNDGSTQDMKTSEAKAAGYIQ